MTWNRWRYGISKMMVWHRKNDRNSHRRFPQRHYVDPKNYGKIHISSKIFRQEASHMISDGRGLVMHKIGEKVVDQQRFEIGLLRIIPQEDRLSIIDMQGKCTW